MTAGGDPWSLPPPYNKHLIVQEKEGKRKGVGFAGVLICSQETNRDSKREDWKFVVSFGLSWCLTW
ncbi:hypothetical protein MUK42_35607 [Musa troglodytarum]|uniref:Uncharacterized protein n=1 Tax=Musa troglodytarum TaxID=320322 RepID=A0A9E7JWA6_9LILI|nr:hypothetical protein MUK42_35607 [Musa troglodytarum]